MAIDPLRDKRSSADGTERRLDPTDLRKTIRTKSLLPLFKKFSTTGALRGNEELKQFFSKSR